MFQNRFVVLGCFTAACRVLNNDSGIALTHHRQGLFNEYHTVSGCRIRRIQNESISGEFFIYFSIIFCIISFLFKQTPTFCIQKINNVRIYYSVHFVELQQLNTDTDPKNPYGWEQATAKAGLLFLNQ